ncbi:MAG: hypothetical protein WCQ32_02360 [bacterium]
MFEAIESYQPQHTFLIQGNTLLYTQYLAELAQHKYATYEQNASRFTMDDALALRAFIIEDTGDRRYCVVYFSAFSPEAAEVLLKILEEPPIETRIIFITPHPYLVPQTIRSRVRVDTTLQKDFIQTEKITKENIATELATALGDEKEEAAIRRERALFFLDRLEYAVRENPTKTKLVYEAKDLLIKGNLPSKQVLEYIATVVF